MKTVNSFFYIAVLLVLFSSFGNDVPAQSVIMESFFDGALNGKDYAADILIDQSGNIYITGKSYQDYGGGEFTTAMYNSEGGLIWADQFKNTQPGYTNYSRRLASDKWQNVYAVGTTALHDGDLAVVKYNSIGRIWANSYQPYWFDTYDDYGIDIGVDSSGYFYAIARVTSPDGNLYDMYVMKGDSSGTRMWEDNYSGASDADYPVDVEVSAGGNVYTLLQQYNFYGSQTRDITTFQYSGSGFQNWFSNYNGPGDGVDYPVSLTLDEMENQYVSGTASMGSDNDMVIMKQNLFGTRLWTVTYGGSAGANDTALAACSLPAGLTAASGRSLEIVDGNTIDAVVVMVIDSGTVVRTDKFYGSDSAGAFPLDMTVDADGNIYVCGCENLVDGTTNGFMIKYDIEGNLVWNASYDGGASLNDRFNAVTLDGDNNVLAAGQSFTSGSNSRMSIVKFENVPPPPTSASDLPPAVSSYTLTQNYPNPFNPSTRIVYQIPDAGNVSLKVYDLLGNEVAVLADEYKPAGRYETEFGARNLSSGVYLYRLQAGSFIQTRKMILLK